MSRAVTKATLLAAIADVHALADAGAAHRNTDALRLAIQRRTAPLLGEHVPTTPERERVRAYLNALASFDGPPGRPTYADEVHGVVPLGGSELVSIRRSDLQAILDGRA